MTDEASTRLAYDHMTPSERQQVLDTLGTLYGFPYRPYTSEEWLDAITAPPSFGPPDADACALA